MDNLVELIGWIGHLLFAFSAIPQAILSYKQGHSKGLSAGLLAMWFFGEFSALIFGLYKNLPIQVILNYILNFSCLLVIIRYYLIPRSPKEGVEE